MSLNKQISCCSGAIRREKPRNCWSDLTKRELHFALNPEVLLPSLGRRLSSISVWTQPELAMSLRFTAIFLGVDRRIITHLSFLSVATSNPSMKPTAPWRYKFSVLATAPSISSRCPASLVRFASSRSRTPAVLLFSASCGLSLSR
jgi:hypothetical protein